ncbi:MAG: hypothetical protein WCK86_18115 [Planctomycetia bacterium]
MNQDTVDDPAAVHESPVWLARLSKVDGTGYGTPRLRHRSWMAPVAHLLRHARAEESDYSCQRLQMLQSA